VAAKAQYPQCQSSSHKQIHKTCPSQSDGPPTIVKANATALVREHRLKTRPQNSEVRTQRSTDTNCPAVARFVRRVDEAPRGLAYCGSYFRKGYLQVVLSRLGGRIGVDEVNR